MYICFKQSDLELDSQMIEHTAESIFENLVWYALEEKSKK